MIEIKKSAASLNTANFNPMHQSQGTLKLKSCYQRDSNDKNLLKNKAKSSIMVRQSSGASAFRRPANTLM
jgi:hypothetical protein